MHFAIFTESVPPQVCGIGDHSQKLAEALGAAGHQATVLARRGLSTDRVEIIASDFRREWLSAARQRLDALGVDHLILQYTPLMFSAGRWRVERELLRCWRALAAGRPTSLIVHETYFRAWWHPPSLLRGTLQKARLRRLAQQSRHVFTASQPLCEEMSAWALALSPVRLPLGSNIPVVEADPQALRRTYDIGGDEVVLTLFGGGTSLKWSAGHVDLLEAVLNEAKVPHCWLLLGGLPRDWFTLTARVLDPGRLSPAALSAHLQLTDLFLMPQVEGLSAKRGTLMAALDHALPVVGTRGAMTDSFWPAAAGVILVDNTDRGGFAATAAGLCRDQRRRRDLGGANAEFYRGRFTWPRIARRFLDAIDID